MKKKLKKLIIISISIVLFIVLVIIFIPDKNIIIKADRITFETEQEFVDTSKYIFIAKVTKKDKTKRYIFNLDVDPITFYNIKQIEFLKGTKINDKSKLVFVGGNKYPKINYVYSDNKEKPKIGYYYLFIILENSGEKDFLLETDYQKIILKNYLEDKSLKDQTKENQEIINKYKNLIKI